MKLGGGPAGGGGGGGGKELRLPWRLRSGGERVLVWIVLACCSPILVPLVCLSLPFVLIIFLCIRSAAAEPAEEGLVDRFKKEKKKVSGGGSSVLLHRYLEDQLKLVLLESDTTCKLMFEI